MRVAILRQTPRQKHGVAAFSGSVKLAGYGFALQERVKYPAKLSGLALSGDGIVDKVKHAAFSLLSRRMNGSKQISSSHFLRARDGGARHLNCFKGRNLGGRSAISEARTALYINHISVISTEY
jgi:hypothetical protein